MKKIIRQYIPLVKFLGEMLGPDFEVVLHEIGGGESHIVAIANNAISGRQAGAPLTNLALKFIADREYEHADYKIGSAGVSPSGARLYTSTYFIKDGRELAGILCINYDRTHYDTAVNALAAIGASMFSHMNQAKSERQETERFVDSLESMILAAVAKAAGSSAVRGDRLSVEEKTEAVRLLDAAGIFILKGSVEAVAKELGSSKATIYRYLSEVRGNK